VVPLRFNGTQVSAFPYGAWAGKGSNGMERESQIRRVLAQVAKKPVEIDTNESLFESGYLDSFALAELVSALEREFAVKIPDSDLIPQRFDSISRILKYLENRLKA
jgi:acyl carrier protein